MVQIKLRSLIGIAALALFIGAAALMLANFNFDDKLSKPPTSCTANTFLQSLTGNSTVCNIVPLATTQTFFFSNETSVNVPVGQPSLRMIPMEELNTTVTKTYSSLVNNATFQNFTTQRGVLNQTFIPQGTWLVHAHASTDKAGFVMIFVNISEVNDTGVFIRTIGTTEHAILDTPEEDYDLTFLSTNATFLQSNTSRIQVNVIDHILQDSPTVTLYFDGITSAGLTFPSAASLDTSNFVPYTGATRDVNLGSHNLTVNNITSPDISNKLNTTGGTSTGLQTFNAGINSSGGTINAIGNVLSPLTPTFSGWTTNPSTDAQITSELIFTTLSTPGVSSAGTNTIVYDTGTSKRYYLQIELIASPAANGEIIGISDDNVNYENLFRYDMDSATTTRRTALATGKFRYVKLTVSPSTTYNLVNMRVYNV